MDTNLPPAIGRYLSGEAREKARQSVEPPLKLDLAARTKFVKRPSLGPAAAVFLDSIRLLPLELCQICHKACLPENPDVSTFYLNYILAFYPLNPRQRGHCIRYAENVWL